MEKTLKSPLDCKDIRTVNPKEINPEYSLVLKLKLQYFGHLMRRADSLERTLMLGKIVGLGATEDEVVGWHHLISGREFEQTPGDTSDREALWVGHKESDPT